MAEPPDEDFSLLGISSDDERALLSRVASAFPSPTSLTAGAAERRPRAFVPADFAAPGTRGRPCVALRSDFRATSACFHAHQQLLRLLFLLLFSSSCCSLRSASSSVYAAQSLSSARSSLPAPLAPVCPDENHRGDIASSSSSSRQRGQVLQPKDPFSSTYYYGFLQAGRRKRSKMHHIVKRLCLKSNFYPSLLFI